MDQLLRLLEVSALLLTPALGPTTPCFCLYDLDIVP